MRNRSGKRYIICYYDSTGKLRDLTNPLTRKRLEFPDAVTASHYIWKMTIKESVLPKTTYYIQEVLNVYN